MTEMQTRGAVVDAPPTTTIETLLIANRGEIACRIIRTAREMGPDRVLVSGARGSAPTSSYKATTTVLDGFRVLTTVLFYGGDATGRARRAGEAILARAARLAQEHGLGPFTETSVEVVGAGELAAPAGPAAQGREAVVKIGARHPEREALQILAREIAPLALVAQGMTGVTGGRTKPAPVIRLVHLLVAKAEVPVTVTLDGGTETIAVAPGGGGIPETPALPEDAAPDAADAAVTVPLRRIAYARSGDKGNHPNIGVIARRPELFDVIREQVTPARVAATFGPLLDGPVRRWELPGMHAINILLEDVLGGRGGTSSLRYDPQGKSYGATLLGEPAAAAVGA